MKFPKNVLIFISLFSIMGCSANSYNYSCPNISNQFNMYKYKKINCMVTNDNRENDEKACIDSKQKSFESNFREYLQPFYDEAMKVDSFLKNGEKIIANIPQINLPYCSEFCYKLTTDINRLFKVQGYKVKALNQLYKTKVTQHWNILKNSLNTNIVSLPPNCKEPLQNLRKYKMRSRNKKDDYYYMYRKEYVDCLNFYLKPRGRK